MSTFDDVETLRGVLEDLPVGISLVGRDGKILFWNYGAERLTGRLRQDVVGHLCREDFLSNAEGDGQTISGGAAAWEAVLRDGHATDAHVSFRHKSGYLVPMRLRATAIRDAHGSIIGVAECFDALVDLSEWDTRHSKLSEFGCLDAATGILTHKMTEARLVDCLANYAETPVPFCVVCISFDHLEDMKARYGAGAVSAVLRGSGQTLQNSLRPTDHLGRWQDNEFLAIVVECTGDEIRKVGERLSKMISREKIAWWGDSLPVTISMGATEAKGGDSVSELMRRAEGALFESIAQGGDRIVVWGK